MKFSAIFLFSLLQCTGTYTNSIMKREVVSDCNHPDCYTYAANMAANIDYSVKPCDDFYRFACGNFPNRQENYNHYTKYSAVNKQLEENAQKFHSVLTNDTVPNEESAVLKAKDMYTACKIFDADLNVKQVNDLVNGLGGWLLGTPVKKQFGLGDSLQLLLTMMNQRKVTVPFRVTVVKNPKYNAQKLIVIAPPSSISEYLPPNVSEIVSLAKFLNPNIDESLATTDAKNVVDFGNLLLQTQIKANAKPLTFNGTAAQLKSLIPKINWNTFLQTIFGDIVIPKDQLIYIENFGYFDAVIRLMEKPEGARILMDYMMLDYIKALMEQFKGRSESLAKNVSFLQLQYNPLGMERWQFCLERVKTCYNYALAWKIGEVYHDMDKEIKQAKELTDNVIYVVKQSLEKSTWLDETSKKEALNKVDHIARLYVYPSWITQKDAVNKYYESLEAGHLAAFHEMQCGKLIRKYELSLLSEPTTEQRWAGDPLVVNAFYLPTANHFEILEAFLQEPIYNPNRMTVMNYGLLAFTIGHEITHGFDNIGVQYDAIGNNRLWLSKTSQEQFNNKTQCLINQYDNLKINAAQLPGAKENVNGDGQHTLRENIADQGGIKFGFEAYKKYIDEHKVKQILPSILGNHLTPDQVFFLSTANFFCEEYSATYPSTTWKRILHGSHSPNILRVIGSVSNSKYFREAYQCAEGTPMNRGNKSCDVW